MATTKTGVELIAEERQRQMAKEDWTASHDDTEHEAGDLARAAAANHADDLARRLLELRQLLEGRVKCAIQAAVIVGLKPIEVQLNLTLDDARRLLELLTETTP